MTFSSDAFSTSPFSALSGQLAPTPLTEIVQSNYRLTLTGAADLTTDIELQMSSFTARLINGSQRRVTAVFPNVSLVESATSARPNGDLVLDKIDIRNDGSTVSETLADVNFNELRSDEGGRNRSITLTGTRVQPTNVAPVTVVVENISSKNLTNNLRRVRSRLVKFTPGDSADADGDIFPVGTVIYFGNGSSIAVDLFE